MVNETTNSISTSLQTVWNEKKLRCGNYYVLIVFFLCPFMFPQSPRGTTIQFYCPVFNLHMKKCKKESLLLTETKKVKWVTVFCCRFLLCLFEQSMLYMYEKCVWLTFPVDHAWENSDENTHDLYLRISENSNWSKGLSWKDCAEPQCPLEVTVRSLYILYWILFFLCLSCFFWLCLKLLWSCRPWRNFVNFFAGGRSVRLT